MNSTDTKTLKRRLKKIEELIKNIDLKKGCSAVEQRISLEKEKNKIKQQLKLSDD